MARTSLVAHLPNIDPVAALASIIALRYLEEGKKLRESMEMAFAVRSVSSNPYNYFNDSWFEKELVILTAMHRKRGGNAACLNSSLKLAKDLNFDQYLTAD